MIKFLDDFRIFFGNSVYVCTFVAAFSAGVQPMNREGLLVQLKEKLATLLASHQDWKQTVTILMEENQKLKQKLKEQQAVNVELKEANEWLKVTNAMLGEKAYKKLMKSKINLLVRRIDQCIDQLKL
ncbi:MAG: hypothetical protein ACMUEM_01070 [Flavobacteriales bacterium AspAUS03]